MWTRTRAGTATLRTKIAANPVRTIVAVTTTSEPSPSEAQFLDVVRRDRLVAVIRARGIADPQGLIGVLLERGIRCIEFTLTTAGALDAITRTTDTNAGAWIGAGTVLRGGQAEQAIDSGARFLVSPALRPDVVRAARNTGVPVVLGAFSPTEVAAGMEVATALKLFPAQLGGPGYIRELLGPLPDARLIPSGSIGPDHVRGFLDAGALAVYAGSALAPGPAVESSDLEEIARRAEAFRSRLGPPPEAVRSS
jgi:2-dehydro-3-deoxyphosphogluconate aldolase / (4S)-4-hydroxy-2-oxoglutarate aldolase